MKRAGSRSFVLLAVLALPTTAQKAGASPPPAGAAQTGFAAPTPVVTNLGLAGMTIVAEGRWAAFHVPEAGQGLDLNGDGDALDDVTHVHDLATGVTTNTGLSTSSVFTEVPIDGSVVVVNVREGHQGNVDLNGDGDTGDEVLHLYNAATGTTTNLGLAVLVRPELADGLLVLMVHEGWQGGSDLNGDGDTLDHVGYVYEVATGSLHPLGLSGGPGVPNRGRVPFLVQEWDEGADFNGDGDASDQVLHVFDATTLTTTNFALAGSFPDPPVLRDDLLRFRVVEADQGAADRNGDGDASDQVLFLHDYRTGVGTNLGLAVDRLEEQHRRIFFTVSELAQGAVDRNGDGDAFDQVLHVYDADSGVLTNLMLESGSGFQPWGDQVAALVHEDSHFGLDRNGDGDVDDTILQVLNLRTGSLLDSGLAVSGSSQSLHPRSRRVVFPLSESSQGVDVNGDGDLFDDVVTQLDLPSGTPTWGLALAAQLEREDGLLLHAVPEFLQGSADRNGDGDALENVLQAVDLPSQTSFNLGLAVSWPFRVVGDQVVLLVSEAEQGNTDLNGDGDADDDVVHVVRFVR